MLFSTSVVKGTLGSVPVLLAITLSHGALASTLTWEDCVKLAAENNPALHAAMASVDSSHNQMLSNWSGFFPQTSGSIGYNYTNTSTVQGGSGIIVGGPQGGNSSGSYTASVTASMNLFNGLADYAKIQQGKANEGIARANLTTVKAQVSYGLKTSFENLDYAQKSVQLAQQIASRREDNLRMVELRFRDGQENKGSVLLYQAYLKDAKYGETQSRDLVETARSQLAQVLGVADDPTLAITGSVPTTEPVAQPDFQKLAVRTPAYLQAVDQEQFANAGITVARSGYFPTLGVTGAAGRSGTWFPEINHWSIGVKLTIPIFNGGRDFFGTKAAIATHQASELTLQNTDHQAETSLRQAFHSYAESVEKLEVDRAYLDAAQVRAEIARANYKNGLTSFQDWDLAETDLITREKNILQSELNRVSAEAAWEQAQGRGVIP